MTRSRAQQTPKAGGKTPKDRSLQTPKHRGLGSIHLALAGVALALAAPLATSAQAAKKHLPGPHATTGAVSHERGNSALLQGTVIPHGAETTYFFEYGPTMAYGSQTTTGTVSATLASAKVGQTASPFLLGYHYRLVAKNEHGTSLGRDRQYTTTAARPRVELTKPSPTPVVIGSAVVITGAVTGPSAADRHVSVESSAFPYLEAFSSIALPVTTNALGRFSVRIPVLTTSTQFRAVTEDTLPMFSGVITEHVAPRVTFQVRSAGRGLVRLYGTVSPAKVGARILFQLEKAARPGRSGRSEETTVRFATVASTATKRGTRTKSRFSAIVSLKQTGRYRAYVQLRSGALVSSGSRTLLIHGAPPRKSKKR